MALRSLDLMIGDWVRWKDDGEFYQISEIDEVVEGEAHVCFIGYNYMVHLDEIEPILITPEVLEKNGFHEEWDEDIKLMVCDTIIVETGNNYKLYKDGKMYLRRVLAPLYYVHQLQHALRLCGVEKTIEL